MSWLGVAPAELGSLRGDPVPFAAGCRAWARETSKTDETSPEREVPAPGASRAGLQAGHRPYTRTHTQTCQLERGSGSPSRNRCRRGDAYEGAGAGHSHTRRRDPTACQFGCSRGWVGAGDLGWRGSEMGGGQDAVWGRLAASPPFHRSRALNWGALPSLARCAPYHGSDTVSCCGAEGVVVGVSGRIDSAVAGEDSEGWAGASEGVARASPSPTVPAHFDWPHPFH